jgi:hypothetical protein
LKKQIEAGYDLPIEVYQENGVYKVIDGGHAWTAYKELNREPKMVKVLTFKDDAEKIAYSRHKNINRLQQTPITYTKSVFQELKMRLGVKTDEEVRKILRRCYNLNYHKEKLKAPSEQDVTYNNIIVSTFQSEPITWGSFTQNNLTYLDFPLWLAEMVDKGELTAEQASLLNKKEIVEKLDEETRKRLAIILRGKSVEATKKGIGELVNFQPQLYNVWNFPNCNPLFGIEYKGRIPGQIVQNVLYYYTKENDLVVDPMAGGGTTIDVCKFMNRRCLAYDINKVRNDITAVHDIRNGYPPETKDADLIFLDPPYHDMVFDFFQTLEEFYAFIEKLAKDSYATIRKNGIVAFIMGNTNWKADGFEDLSFKSYQKFIDARFKTINRISVPFSTEQYEAFDVKKTKEEKKMLSLVRDLIIFEKV